MTIELLLGLCYDTSAARNRIALYVIPTDEELMIARHTLVPLSGRGAHSHVIERAHL